MTYTIKLTFETDKRNKITISIPNADADAEDAAVDDAMDTIIDTEAVYTKSGSPVAKSKAELVSTSIYEYRE